ncbi:MAG: hypothetical protein NPIRA06_28900 [Nitrospirales bacterium]|nr:MAG: hypothetical protein NPIRA06_28900 [Nitrospirales bacterium]
MTVVQLSTIHSYPCHAEQGEASSQTMARSGWAQILRFIQDEMNLAQEDLLEIFLQRLSGI